MASPNVGPFQVLYFAAARDLTNCESDVFDAAMPLSTLLALLEDKYPGLKTVIDRSAITRNLEYIDVPGEGDNGNGDINDIVIEPGDVIAIIPPVSSG